ncbi:hypothetical protein GT185_005302 [Salmonella enterica]|nr:hypothetical protein [Salmonella enterica]
MRKRNVCDADQTTNAPMFRLAYGLSAVMWFPSGPVESGPRGGGGLVGVDKKIRALWCGLS